MARYSSPGPVANRPYRPRIQVLWAATLLCALVFTGCAHVAPYERGGLSHPSMDAASEAEQVAFEAHLREAREGSTFGASAAGGGCGCN